ncbi:Bacteriorhodopsin [Geodermatophilus pulveris]|uniref:Bacteriorhodopsin n=1 Tax=Geodermatophilus pulveris TaxID=1564159 RepID=A0A239HH55_9ACTN|nr:bacteriorhodopsin [Geodermatophilus pulveris]SNS80697.1 Bacteriorhodopsin [Geodermatophilus pulveris]
MAETDPPVPELQTLSPALYDVGQFAVLGAGLALLAYLLYAVVSRDEVSARYRPSAHAAICLAGVATAAYALLLLDWDTGFRLVDGSYRPTEEARTTEGTRYVDWSVTVPLLTVELLAVCSVAGTAARRLRASTMAAAFLMILTGYLGAQVVDQGRDRLALVVWGLVSTAFLGYLYVALIGAVRRSLPTMGPEAAASLRNATTVLLASFGAYPVVYAVPVFADVTPAWFVTMQVGYSVADVVAKVGFGVLVHKVAKLRTAEDVAAGADTHPEPVWSANVRESEAVPPVPGRRPAGS